MQQPQLPHEWVEAWWAQQQQYQQQYQQLPLGQTWQQQQHLTWQPQPQPEPLPPQRWPGMGSHQLMAEWWSHAQAPAAQAGGCYEPAMAGGA